MERPISIIILANCDASLLGETLPEMLAQQYAPGYEVVVVRDSKKGTMTDMLEGMMTQYPNLRTTYLPAKPQYVTDEEIEILLGVKAAEYDDAIMVAPWFMPPSDEWLKTVADNLNELPIQLSEAPYADGTSWFARRRHRKATKKMLKNWCRDNGFTVKELTTEKDKRNLYSVAFKCSKYMDNSELREIIHQHQYV